MSQWNTLFQKIIISNQTLYFRDGKSLWCPIGNNKISYGPHVIF